MSTTNTKDRVDEKNDFVRALSHDMSANFMLLESSFSHLKKSLDEISASAQPKSEPIAAPLAQESLADVGDYVAHVDACLQESRRLLDDLALLARTGTVEMEPQRVKLADVLDEVLFEQDELLQQHGIEVVVRRPLPVFWCNPGRLKQIVTNLIRNAARHGCDPQRPRIVVSAAAAQSNDRNMTAFHVHDNGPGIDPQLHREIFLPGRRYADDGVDGSGMGLAIVEKLAMHYGGSACIDSNISPGTAFLVTLPAAAQQDGSSRSSEPSSEPSSEQGPSRWQLELDGRHVSGRSQRYKPRSLRSH
ncbi:MAG TPA: HAMP domain-containing sensor histidine kinase [Thermoguttaceae bacterium]|nr:HAMP domain-containing sensor histidine kinase [Thermoguttaceae bacterium]